MKRELLEDLEAISQNLPKNTIDEIINRLGGKSKVAELTGRKGRVVYNTAEEAYYELRTDNCNTDNMINIQGIILNDCKWD